MPEPEIVFAPENPGDPDSRWSFAPAPGRVRRERAMAVSARYNRLLAEWVTSGSFAEACLVLGYHSSFTKRTKNKLSQRYPEIFNEVHRRRKAIARRVELNQEEVVLELARLAFANISDVVTWVDGRAVIADSAMIPADALAAIQEISCDADGKMKIKLHDKKGALVDLGKFMGLTQPDGVAELLAKLAKLAGVAGAVDAEPVLDKRETARRVALLLRHANAERERAQATR